MKGWMLSSFKSWRAIRDHWPMVKRPAGFEMRAGVAATTLRKGIEFVISELLSMGRGPLPVQALSDDPVVARRH